jgi:hypothetical protein
VWMPTSWARPVVVGSPPEDAEGVGSRAARGHCAASAQTRRAAAGTGLRPPAPLQENGLDPRSQLRPEVQGEVNPQALLEVFAALPCRAIAAPGDRTGIKATAPP